MSKKRIPTVIGEGTYGCVHNPSLLCENAPENLSYNNKISKILAKKTANEELNEFKNIRKIDTKEDFHSGVPVQCAPKDDKKQRSYIRKCTNPRYKKALKVTKGVTTPLSNNLSLLVMKDGGLDLRKFVGDYSNRAVNYDNRKIIQNFFIEFERAFIALRKLEDTGYVHNDLKLDNIVYNPDTNRLNYIDFGLTSTYNSIKNKATKDDYYLAQECHWSFPPDIVFINKTKFKNAIYDLGKKKSVDTVKKKYFYEDEYGKYSSKWASYALSDIYPGVTTVEYDNIKRNRNADLYDTIKYIKENSWSDFIVKAIFTIDSYGVGMALAYSVRKFKPFLENNTYIQLLDLCETMTSWNITKRKNCHDLTREYQNILDRTGLLAYNNKQISVSDMPTIIPIPVHESRVKTKPINIPKARTDAARPETPIPTVFSNIKPKSKSKTKAKKSKSKNKTRKSDNYSVKQIWKGQALRNRLFSLQGKPEKKGDPSSGKFGNMAALRKEIRRLEIEQGKPPKTTPTPVNKKNKPAGLLA